MTKKDLRKAIKADLLEQLERNCTTGQYYTNLVDDYMIMWDTKNQLAEDIENRGAVVDKVYSNGTITQENNRSTEQFLKVNAQMLKLLDSLGIKPAQVEDDTDDEL